MISNALSLLFGIIIIAAVVPYVFVQFGGLQEAVEGRCVAKHIRPIAFTVARPYPADNTTWSVGQDWQAGGPFITESVPTGMCEVSLTQTRRYVSSNTWATSGTSPNDFILYDYTPTDVSGNNFGGVISALIELMPVAIFVGIFGLVVTFAWKKFGSGRGGGVPGM